MLFRGLVLLVVRLVLYQTSHLKMLAIIVIIKANANTSVTETYLSSKSERNKGKLDHWRDQQVQVLRKMRKEYQKF